MQTRVSAKGQVVIPKDVRDRLRWHQGQPLDIVETSDGVLLKQPVRKRQITVAEGLARIRARVTYDGPPVPVEEMDAAIGEMFRNTGDERF